MAGDRQRCLDGRGCAGERPQRIRAMRGVFVLETARRDTSLLEPATAGRATRATGGEVSRLHTVACVEAAAIPFPPLALHARVLPLALRRRVNRPRRTAAGLGPKPPEQAPAVS